MKEDKSSNLSGSTSETPVKQAFLTLSAPSKKRSAPSIYTIEFEVEGPNSTDMEKLPQINCINCNMDVTKRWYVEYYIICPKTNKRLRKREYGYINKEKNALARQELLESLKIQISQSLEIKTVGVTEFVSNDNNSVTYYINQYLANKRKSLEFESTKTYVRYLKCFHLYLKKKGLTHLQPIAITKHTILDFRNSITGEKSNRSVNNNMDCVSSFFEHLVKQYENLLLRNPCANIEKLPSQSECHVAYTKKQATEISEYLKIHDPELLNYCRFVAYGFLRCKETRHLKIGDIDFERKTITLAAKSAKVKRRIVKPMLETLYQNLLEMNLQNYPPNYYVFSLSRGPGTWITYEKYFQKKYKKVKDHFGLSNLYTIYSFRHTFVCELLDSGANWHEIMKYTGHTTFAAFEKYARSLMAKPAIDLSSNISINF